MVSGIATGSAEWVPIDVFARIEGLAISDFVRLIERGIAPRLQTVDEQVFVHTPTLYDWRELVKIQNFRFAGVRATGGAAHAN
jgi:hypothetical protein